MRLTSQYQISAALWVVRAIDISGTSTAVLDAAFHGAVTQGRFSRPDLDNALQLLAVRDLVITQSGMLRQHGSLIPLMALPDEAALELLSGLLDAVDESESAQSMREVVGSLGEEAVVAWCATELLELGRVELVPQVQRVSLISDRFGYDVSAPSIRGGSRKLEVKSTSSSSKTFRFFLTRNEYEVGRRNLRTWALVACRVHHGTAAVIGWCRVSELERYLPEDAHGRWTEALVNLPVNALIPKVPSAVS